MCEVVVNHAVARMYHTVFPFFFPVDIWVILGIPGLPLHILVMDALIQGVEFLEHMV